MQLIGFLLQCDLWLKMAHMPTYFSYLHTYFTNLEYLKSTVLFAPPWNLSCLTVSQGDSYHIPTWKSPHGSVLESHRVMVNRFQVICSKLQTPTWWSPVDVEIETVRNCQCVDTLTELTPVEALLLERTKLFRYHWCRAWFLRRDGEFPGIDKGRNSVQLLLCSPLNYLANSLGANLSQKFATPNTVECHRTYE